MRPDSRLLRPDDLVVRGCQNEPPDRLLLSMREHYSSPRTADFWALSVAALPGADEAEIIRQAGHLRQSHYRVAKVGDLRRITLDAGIDLGGAVLSVVWEHAARGLVVTMEAPHLEVAAHIASAFGLPKPNPHHEPPQATGARRASAATAALYVDVNSVRDANQVGTTVAAAVAGFDSASLAPGARLWAIDADDNAGEAVVTERRGDWLRLRIDQSSWAPLTVLSGARRGRGPAPRRVMRRATPAPQRDRGAHRHAFALQSAGSTRR